MEYQPVLLLPPQYSTYSPHLLQRTVRYFPPPKVYPQIPDRPPAETCRPKPHKTTVTESANLKYAIDCTLRVRGTKFFINDICSRFDIKRRVFFDFLSIVSRIGLCSRLSNEQFESNGISPSPKLWDDLNEKAKTDLRCLSEAFSCESDSSLSYVTERLLALFCYLKTDILDLRKVARLFSHGTLKLKTMMRKLYTISVALEAVDLLKRTGKPAEIRIIMPKTGEAVFGIRALLNTDDELRFASLAERRRTEFDQIAKQMGYISDFSELYSPPHSPPANGA